MGQNTATERYEFTQQQTKICAICHCSLTNIDSIKFRNCFPEHAILKLRQMSLAIQSVISLWRMEGSNLGFSQYDYSHIKEATNNFSVDNKLGQGGFGPVYKVLCSYIANGPLK